MSPLNNNNNNDTKMHLLLLCAGYGTRLEKDLEASHDESLQHLRGLPKPLLPVLDKPLISYWVKAASEASDIESVIIITNEKYANAFNKWKDSFMTSKSVYIINDGTTCNEDRLGAVADIRFAIKSRNLDADHLLIIAGDTLFFPAFSLTHFIEKFQKLQIESPASNLIVHCPCPEDRVHRHGIVELEQDEVVPGCHLVTSFLEKPQPTMTSSRWQSPCFYLLHALNLSFVDAFLASTKHLPLANRDAPGHFLSYLIKKSAVFSCFVSGRFDVGNLETYLECNESLRKQLKDDTIEV